jgi:poly-gamma-glutamate synthase PgsB/CapB
MRLYIILMGISLVVLLLGFAESFRNRRNVQKLKIRINVNGIRGKSTVTRLITAILHESGYKTIGKTTGTAARLIIPAESREESIRRRPNGVSINEQMRTINWAVKNHGAEALVCECMAVRPYYQDAVQNQMLYANITVIVNVLEDHLDVMGPTTDEIATAFSKTIPYNGWLIVNNSPFISYFQEMARQRNTRIIVADSSEVPSEYLDQFNYVIYPDNVALSLAVAQALDIDRDTALRGMLRAAPDPGVLRLTMLDKARWNGAVFVNGFAANEPASSWKIWEKISCMEVLPLENPIVLFNGRPDRLDRTTQFIQDFFPRLQGVVLIGMGQAIKSIEASARKKMFSGITEYIHLENMSPTEVARRLMALCAAHNRVIFGVGNIHGDGEKLLDIILEKACPGSAVSRQQLGSI